MDTDQPIKKERVKTYIDGFNLYFGMKKSGLKHCYWLNPELLVKRILRPDQESVGIKYFTSQISGPPSNRQRQLTWVEAIETLSSVTVIRGQFVDDERQCPHCRRTYLEPGEKMTDVNIAINLMMDAFHDEFDVALLISGDSDLVPPVRAIQQLYPAKRVVVAFPPNRVSSEQKRATPYSFTLFSSILERSRFPETVVRSDGFLLRSPWPLEKTAK